MNNNIDGVLIDVFGQIFRCYRNGDVFRRLNTGVYKLVQNTGNNKGYNLIGCNNKMVYRHRIIFYAFNPDFNIYNPTIILDHIDGNRLNNALENLRIVTSQENNHNKLKCKGYGYDKISKKYRSYIILDYKYYHLGYFNTRWEARQAYIDAIPTYHPTAPIHLFTNEEDDCPFKKSEL
jgi:hypothetical protein